MQEHKKMLTAAQSEMKRLSEQLGLTLGLGVLLPQKARVLVIGQERPSGGFSYSIDPGLEVLLYTSAPGKILLAYLSKAEQDEIIESISFKSFTSNTLADEKALRKQLAQARFNGYALDESEELEGCHCLGTAIFDEQGNALASIWATGPSSLFPQDKFVEVAEEFKSSAALISKNLQSGKRSQQQQYMQEVIVSAERFIVSHHAEGVDMQALAASLHVSYTWFRRSFKKYTGLSPQQYLLDYRLEKAEGLLSETDIPISKIAERLGFASAEYFSTIFKKKKGASPLYFREQKKA